MKTGKRGLLVSILVGALVGAVGGWFVSERIIYAQTPIPTALQLVGSAPHTTCTVTVTTTTFCFANDGLWQSLNGAAYVQLGVPAASGVTSFNGRTGAVVPVASDYPDAVTSVNGKTGAVVLGATTTLQ